MHLRKLSTLTLAAFVAAGGAFGQSRPGDHWVATWAAAMTQTNLPAAPAKPAAGAPPGRGGGRGGFAPAVRSFNNQTVRMVVNTSIGGRQVRVRLSNAFGRDRLKIGAAHIALHDAEGAIVPASDRTLMFSGNATAIIPAGALLLSDPVDLAVPATGDLVVSLYLPEDSGPPTSHGFGLHTTYISGPGDFTGAREFTAAMTTAAWYFLAGVDVLAPASAGAVAAFGDSITDGVGSQANTNGDWPSVLARRLQAEGRGDLAVINLGISGNQVLRDGAGVNALARFERDVLSQPGVKYVMFLEAINDIGIGAGPNAPAGSDLSAGELIAAYRQMIERAHAHGIKVIGCTLTPYVGASYASERGEAIRAEVNAWIRTTGLLDGVADFEAATRDPANPQRMRPEFTRDNLHPNQAGYQAIVAAIDLALFK